MDSLAARQISCLPFWIENRTNYLAIRVFFKKKTKNHCITIRGLTIDSGVTRMVRRLLELVTVGILRSQNGVRFQSEQK